MRRSKSGGDAPYLKAAERIERTTTPGTAEIRAGDSPAGDAETDDALSPAKRPAARGGIYTFRAEEILIH
jgi:hypothetical protein